MYVQLFNKIIIIDFLVHTTVHIVDVWLSVAKSLRIKFKNCLIRFSTFLRQSISVKRNTFLENLS